MIFQWPEISVSYLDEVLDRCGIRAPVGVFVATLKAGCTEKPYTAVFKMIVEKPHHDFPELKYRYSVGAGPNKLWGYAKTREAAEMSLAKALKQMETLK